MVQVVLPELDRGTLTDSDGRYHLEGLPLDSVLVEFRFIGFEPVSRRVRIAQGENELHAVLSETTYGLREAVVSAESQADVMLTRSTRSVAVLDTRELEDMRGQTLGGMLAELPGVTSLTTGPSISKPVIRGLHSQRIVVVNAGVQQEGQQWGGEHAPEIDPFSAGRIEVIRGAAGVEYGVGAIGGVVRIEPEELPFGGPISGSVSINAFSNNRHGALSAAVGRGQGANWAWRLQGSARKAGDSRTPDHVIGNSGFQETDVAGTLGWHRGQSGFRLHASHFGTTLGLFTGAHIGNFDDLMRAIERGQPAVDFDFTFDIDAPKQEIRHDLVSLSAHTGLPSGDWLEVQTGFQSNRRAEFDAHRRFGDPDEDPAFSLDLRSWSADARVRQRPRGNITGNVGATVTTQGNKNGESGFLIPNFRSTTVSGFIHEMWVTDKLTLDTGLRYDYRWQRAFPKENLSSGPFVPRTTTYSDVSAVLGVIWRPLPHWSIASNVGRAWRPPGINELYNFGVHHGTAQFETGNPDLREERSLNVDATVRHVSERLTLELSAYRNAMDGFIFLFPENEPRVTIRGTFPAFRYVQRDVVLRGLDGFVDAKLIGRLRGHASTSIVRGSETDTNLDLIDMPADRIRAGLEWAFRDRPWLDGAAIHADVESVARQDHFPEGVDFAPPPDGYTLVHIGSSGTWTRGSVPITFSLDINNVFDVAYRDYLSRFRYFIDDPGRNVSVRVHIPFGPGNNSKRTHETH